MYADRLWAAALIDTEPWRVALTKPGMSAYDLWMREAVRLSAHGSYYPDYPSVSGGWSTNNLISGHKWQPPACCIPDYIDGWSIETRYSTPTHHHVYVTVYASDPRRPVIGIKQITVQYWGYPIKDWVVWPPVSGVSPYVADGYIPIDAPDLWSISVDALDGTASMQWCNRWDVLLQQSRHVQPSESWLCRGEWPRHCVGGKEVTSTA